MTTPPKVLSAELLSELRTSHAADVKLRTQFNIVPVRDLLDHIDALTPSTAGGDGTATEHDVATWVLWLRGNHLISERTDRLAIHNDLADLLSRLTRERDEAISDRDFRGEQIGMFHRKLTAAESQLAAAREALEKIGEMDVPRPVGEPYAQDGSPSKHDKCTHGRRMWEDCDECTAAFARQHTGSAKP